MVLTIRAMTGGEGYAQRHLQQSDYYDQNRTVEGRWHGRGAELLGLKGEVTSEDFDAVRQGLDPQTGEFLRQRHGADRFASNGEEQSKARSHCFWRESSTNKLFCHSSYSLSSAPLSVIDLAPSPRSGICLDVEGIQPRAATPLIPNFEQR